MQDDDHKQLHLQLDALAVGSDHNPEQIIIPWPILDAMGIKYRNEFERRGGKSSGWKLYSRMLFYEGVIEEQIIKERRPHPALITHLISVRAQREWLMWHGYLKKQ
ncbi:MAG: hypothetical protein LBM12_02655 [Candidatus Nomurabacteria bacterium]|nr:hypothetical protein [Candidatus Nomurabacteria bacterium]